MGNGGAELRAGVEIGEGEVEAGLHYSNRAGREDEALKVKTGHEDFYPRVEVAEAVLWGDIDVFKDELAGVGPSHAEFVEFSGAGETGRGFGFDDKGGDAFATGLGIGFGVDDNVVGVGAVGDPHFTAIEEPSAVACLLCGRFHTDDIGACRVLGHGEGADFGPGD